MCINYRLDKSTSIPTGNKQTAYKVLLALNGEFYSPFNGGNNFKWEKGENKAIPVETEFNGDYDGFHCFVDEIDAIRLKESLSLPNGWNSWRPYNYDYDYDYVVVEVTIEKEDILLFGSWDCHLARASLTYYKPYCVSAKKLTTNLEPVT